MEPPRAKNGDDSLGAIYSRGAGEALRYFALEQARLLAIRTAREEPPTCGRRFAAARMKFQVVSQDERGDHCFVTLSYQPEGDFLGMPGQERFVIEKAGAVVSRRIFSLPKVEGRRRFLWKPIAIAGALMAVVVAAMGCASDSGIAEGEEKAPVQVDATSVPPASGKLTLFLVPSAGEPRSLSLSGAGLGKVSLAKVPLIFGQRRTSYGDLRSFLWTESALTFSGTGFSGAWNDEKARLVMQLNGPLEGANYLRCVGLRINGEEESSSCATSFSSYEFVTGGYQVEAILPAPERLESTDRLEVSIVLATPLQEGEKVVPTLVFGGDVPLKTSFLEIGGGQD